MFGPLSEAADASTAYSPPVANRCAVRRCASPHLAASAHARGPVVDGRRHLIASATAHVRPALDRYQSNVRRIDSA